MAPPSLPPPPPPPMPRRSTFLDNIQQPAVDADDDDYESRSKHDNLNNNSGNNSSGDGRSTSTTLRLQGQGFRRSQRLSDFAVRSIRRGSRQWNDLLRLFVADLAFRSVVTRRFQSEVSFRPYTCDAAAVLFVDLSHYSKIAAAVVGNNNQHGAHALSTTVNDYLDRLLALVDWHEGDVVKFAGDAVLVVWEGQSQQQLQQNEESSTSTSPSILELNVLTAAKCVLEMLQQAGSHPVEGTDLQFRIHCGLSCGHLESEVFAAPVHANMQRLFHSVGGDAVVELGELVDLARAGEVCVSDDVAQILRAASRGGASFRDVEEASFGGGQILTQLEVDATLLETMDMHVRQLENARAALRNKAVEEEFIHPKVIHLLSHSGLSPSQISQMRNLCVLFIAMTSNGSSVNWLMEVQSILDKNRCPIVQIIDDDKGVHLVAAVNLYESIPECSLFGLEVCRELVEKQVGCAIGMASGSTFCGVTGSASVACRWDITGVPPVRAARLMQFALQSGIEVAIDQSVYNDPMAATRLEVLHRAISLKGTEGTLPVYTLSDSSSYAAFRVLETVHGRVHDDVVREIETLISQSRSRLAVMVTGVSLAGKKIVCQRAAGNAGFVPYLHLADASAGFVQLARTIATWFQYVDNEDVRKLATDVLYHIGKNHWSRSHDLCIELVDLSLEKGLRSCFLIDRIQFLDEFSLSLLRECMYERKQGPSYRRRSSRRRTSGALKLRKLQEYDQADSAAGVALGKVCFLCVHVSLYNWKSVSHVVENITRSQLEIPIIKLGEARKEDLRIMFRDLSDMEVEDRWLDAYAEASGLCAGYFIERAAAIRVLSGKLWSEGKRAYAETSEELVLHIPRYLIRINTHLPVRQVRAEISMRFSQVFDELPPLFQTASKVLTIATRTGFFRLPREVLWEVLNELILEGVERRVFHVLVNEMTEMCLLKSEYVREEEVLSFQSPALADVAFDVSTPEQIECVGYALIERLEPLARLDFQVPLVLAYLHHLTNKDEEKAKAYYLLGYQLLLRSGLNNYEINKWKEYIDEEIHALGLVSTEILGNSFTVDCHERKAVGKRLPLLKIYSAPVSLGPMGHTLSVLTRNTFHEYGFFHGYSSEAIARIRSASQSASQRYICEMAIVEAFLSEHGFPATAEAIQEERDMITTIAKPAESDLDVQRKAVMILDEFVPRCVTTRLERLYSLVEKLRLGGIPPVMERSDPPLRRAYEALRAPKCRADAVQDALMIMATMNWKPKPVPEYLPLLHYQTVARIRSKVLICLNDAELFIFKHQQTHLDFEAFLIVTSLLYEDATATAQPCVKK